MIKYLKETDFDCVDVSRHCNFKKLNIAIEEALLFDFKDILKGNYGYIYQLITKDPEEELTALEKNLLNGFSYQCGKHKKNFLGVKRMLVYYSYARYVFEIHYNDSGLGLKEKTDPFSTPVPIREINAIQDANRNKGLEVLKQLNEALCYYKEELKGFMVIIDCECDCIDNHSGQKTSRSHTNVFTKMPRIITKY